MQRRDITNQRFGKLVALYRLPEVGSFWMCRCDCGKEIKVKLPNLLRGVTQSCGCTPKHTTRRGTHHKSRTPVYHVWTSIKMRCLVPQTPGYKDYGGRGITVCDRWKDSFENFYADMGDIPFEGAQIDRIDNDGNYEPNNCRWATRIENANNQRKTIKIQVGNEEIPLSYLVRDLNIPHETIRYRRRLGWTDEELLAIPYGISTPEAKRRLKEFRNNNANKNLHVA